MTGLILKLSYNDIGEPTLTGGICGSFFVVESNLAITANHVLNKKDFKPNNGFLYCQFWLIVQPDFILEIHHDSLIEFPEIDTTFVRLDKVFNLGIRKLSYSDIQVGRTCFNEGFVAGKMPSVKADWEDNELRITSCTNNGTEAIGQGYVKSNKVMHINTADIKMINVKGLETSYGGNKGMSGGPLIDEETNEIIGLMSIGLPANVQNKVSLFAISIEEIKVRMKNIA